MRPLFTALVLAVLTRSLVAAPAPSQFGTSRYVEYIPGDLPVILVSPHGGRLRPDAIPDRQKGVMDSDLNTQELARAMAAALEAATGRRPHLIVSHLHRRKLDPNREIREAAGGAPPAEQAWHEFHAFIRAATQSAAARHGFGFLIDVHGHSHRLPRLELGYGLGEVQLAQPDAAFDASNFAAITSVSDLHRRLGTSGADLIRGPRSLGALFVAGGVRAVPSPAEPSPGPGAFFSGGYIVRTHAGGTDTPKIDGVQFECYKAGIRDTAENRARFASVFTSVLTTFLRERYAFEPARQP